LFAAEVSKELDSTQSTAKSIMDAVKNSVLMGDAGKLNTTFTFGGIDANKENRDASVGFR